MVLIKAVKNTLYFVLQKSKIVTFGKVSTSNVPQCGPFFKLVEIIRSHEKWKLKKIVLLSDLDDANRLLLLCEKPTKIEKNYIEKYYFDYDSICKTVIAYIYIYIFLMQSSY